jgi:hypothetical protein
MAGPDNDEHLKRKRAAEARIRERNAWPPGPLHQRAAAIFDEWAAQAAAANPQSDLSSEWAYVQRRKKEAVKEAKEQLRKEAIDTAGSRGAQQNGCGLSSSCQLRRMTIPRARPPSRAGFRLF